MADKKQFSNMKSIVKVETGSYRFVLLFFTCLLTFGMYFCFDMPGVLQHRLEGISNCTDNTTRYNESCVKCEDCLGMSSKQFNLLYAIYAWTNAILGIGAGVLIDRLGNTVGVLLFSFLCLLGTSTFAVGAMLKDTDAMFPLMLAGRLIFGSGGGSLLVVQSTVIAYWFRNKELAFSFAWKTAMSRLASVLNFLFSESLANHYGLVWTLWIGVILCGVAFLSAIIVSIMDLYGVQQLGDHQALKTQSKKIKISDMKHFSLTFWLLVITVMFYYVSLWPFMADASLFVHQKYDYSPRTSSIIVGVVYDMSIVLVPFIGLVIDHIGKRSIMLMVCSCMMIPVYIVFAFTHIHPLVGTAWLGFSYSIASGVIWPALPLVVKQSMLGTAMGLTNSIEMLGVGIANLSVGEILGKNNSLPEEERLVRWRRMMIFLICTTSACFTMAIFVNISDNRREGILNLSRKQMMESKMLETESTIEPETMNSTSANVNTSTGEKQPLLGQ